MSVRRGLFVNLFGSPVRAAARPVRPTRRSLAAGFVAAFVASGIVLAQQAPQPGPEVKKLEPFAGKWKGEAEMKPGPWGPGGKISTESECTWFEGGFELVCRESGTGPMGKMKSESVLGWSHEEKVYKYQGFDSTGMMGTATGKLDGNTWIWHGTDKMGGKTIHSRYTVKLDSATAQSFKWETSEDGKKWTVAAEGKSTKQ